MMKFNLDIILISPDKTREHNLKLKAVFGKSKREGEYGNGMYLSVTGRRGTNFEQLFDIRYEKVDTDNLELFLLNWAYNNWSGKNGSWDIKSLKIARYGS